MVSALEHRGDLSPKIQFVINPSAGQGKYERIIHAIRETLSDSSLQYDIKVLEYKGEATAIAREAANTHGLVVAVGGDGTVSSERDKISVNAGNGKGYVFTGAGLGQTATNRLAENLELTYHGVLEDFVGFKLLAVHTLQILLQPLDGVEHVAQVRKVSVRHRTGLRFSRGWSLGSKGLALVR